MSKRLILLAMTMVLVLALGTISSASIKLTFWDMFSGGDPPLGYSCCVSFF